MTDTSKLSDLLHKADSIRIEIGMEALKASSALENLFPFCEGVPNGDLAESDLIIVRDALREIINQTEERHVTRRKLF